MSCLYITLFFNIVANTTQTFIQSWNQLLYPSVTEVRLPFETHHAYGATAVTAASMQEYGEKPKFHLQSQWIPETHLFPVRNV
jgi:hypothetical protein